MAGDYLGARGSICDDENVLKLSVVMASQPYPYIKTIEQYPLMSFVCVLYYSYSMLYYPYVKTIEWYPLMSVFGMCFVPL